MKKYIIYTSVLIGLWFSLWGYFSWSVLDMTNLTFLIGLMSLTLFVILKIIQSGFFKLFASGIGQLGSFIFRKSNAQIRTENQLKEDRQLQEFKWTTYNWFLTITLVTAIGSLAMSLLGLVLFYK